MNRNPAVCSICLQSGHHRSTCDREIVCKTCRQPGHKSGDPACTMSPPDSQSDLPNNKSGGRKETQGTGATHGNKEKTVKKKDSLKLPPGTSNNRGRPISRQITLGRVFGAEHNRSRSETPKRRRSREQESPTAATSKQPKHAEVSQTDPVGTTKEKADDDVVSIWY